MRTSWDSAWFRATARQAADESTTMTRAPCRARSDRVAAVAAAELEDAPAVAAAHQPVDRVVGQAGTEANRAGGERRPGQ